jgi:hypothetical protein
MYDAQKRQGSRRILYAEAERLNDSGVPGTRYGSGERKPERLWQSKILSNIVHQSAYIGVHCVKINGGEEVIEHVACHPAGANLRGRGGDR